MSLLTFSEFFLNESAPPDPEIEKWILDVKPHFKKTYGKNWEAPLYATAWRKYRNKQKIHENFDPNNTIHDHAMLARPYHNMLVNDYDYTFKGHKLKHDQHVGQYRQYNYSHPDLGQVKMMVHPGMDDKNKVSFYVNKKYVFTPEHLPFAIASAKLNPLTTEEHIGFKNLEHKLEGQGKSEESAKKIAAYIGNKKYGKKRMQAAAHAHKPL